MTAKKAPEAPKTQTPAEALAGVAELLKKKHGEQPKVTSDPDPLASSGHVVATDSGTTPQGDA